MNTDEEGAYRREGEGAEKREADHRGYGGSEGRRPCSASRPSRVSRAASTRVRAPFEGRLKRRPDVWRTDKALPCQDRPSPQAGGAEGRCFAPEHTILWMAMPSLLNMVRTFLTSRAVALY